jgi:hypothetical protein
MNLPRGTLEKSEELKDAQPIDYLSKLDATFSGVVRFFERGKEWNVFFLLFETGSIIGYYAIKGDISLKKVLYTVIERFEIEVRSFSEAEMRIARKINTEYLLSEPVDIIKEGETEKELDSIVKGFFPDESFAAEVEKAKKFREAFLNRRVSEAQSSAE